MLAFCRQAPGGSGARLSRKQRQAQKGQPAGAWPRAPAVTDPCPWQWPSYTSVAAATPAPPRCPHCPDTGRTRWARKAPSAKRVQFTSQLNLSFGSVILVKRKCVCARATEEEKGVNLAFLKWTSSCEPQNLGNQVTIFSALKDGP